jgi:hypothetical protein
MHNEATVGERYKQVMVACEEERRRFREAIGKGAKPILKTAFGPYTVTGVSEDWWYSTTAGASFCGCNDHGWADMMKQAGVARHPLFADS